ncbi:sphingomyelin phosphodiesterase 5 [Pan troglodytes]|uniref:sphingomyelin phosphodiesterase 5 n=1 Tax=Pan troglodytes TaxID=9598 RepID=UPI0023F101F2|nr:sphingomyelin phosphodiesterase 5 [Pan troglodytes]
MLTCVGAGTGEPEAAHTVRPSPALRRPHSRKVVLHVPLAASRSRLRSLRQHLTGFAHRLCHAAFTPVYHAIPARLAPGDRRPAALALPAPGAARPPRLGPRAAVPGLLGPGPAAGWLRRAAGGGAALLLLLVVGPPLALPGLPLWLVPQVWRRPFCYRSPPLCWAPPALWRPPAEPRRCFVFLTANLCLLPDGQARFGNLPHSQRPAEAIGAALLGGARPALYRATDCSQPWPRALRGTLVASLPVGLDFVCLQEVFDLRRARRLVNRLAPNLGPLLYDVGTLGLQPGRHLKLLDSGLLLASRYPLLRATFRCFPHARGEDALASKGLPSAQARLGSLDGRRIVGFLHCTHLQVLAGEPCGWVLGTGPASPERLLIPTFACTPPPTSHPLFTAPGTGIPEKCLSGLTDQELRRRELTVQDAVPNLEPSPPHPPSPTQRTGPCAANS